jgi:type III restriction enzyme
LAWPLDWAPQPDAVILWVSDMPELNEQTKLKIESKSDKVYRVNQLITIDAHFDAPRLDGGRIYFINTQKLAVNQPLTNRGDGRQHLIWETLTNTARAVPDRFYVVIDEAHRGMTSGKGAQAAQTLMQRFLLGYPEVGLVKMPMVIGVSATPKRFLDLIANAEHTVTTHKVDPRAAREANIGTACIRVFANARCPVHSCAGVDLRRVPCTSRRTALA